MAFLRFRFIFHHGNWCQHAEKKRNLIKGSAQIEKLITVSANKFQAEIYQPSSLVAFTATFTTTAISVAATVAEAVTKARRSYELNRIRVFENQGLPIETLQAIQSLATARTMHRDAVIDYNLAQFQLYTAIGQPGK